LYIQRNERGIDISGKRYRHFREILSTSGGNGIDISGKGVDTWGKNYRHLREELSTSRGRGIDIWGNPLDIWGKIHKLSTPCQAV
jgi:hypothetical protein